MKIICTGYSKTQKLWNKIIIVVLIKKKCKSWISCSHSFQYVYPLSRKFAFVFPITGNFGFWFLTIGQIFLGYKLFNFPNFSKIGSALAAWLRNKDTVFTLYKLVTNLYTCRLMGVYGMVNILLFNSPRNLIH